MNDELFVSLNGFLSRASKATYAGNGNEAKAWRKGFKELEYGEGDWYYRDSYSGYLRSWGQEVVWLNDEPIWTCLYGGGMTKNYMDGDFAEKTFTFLKRALSEGNKEISFQPRGPEELIAGSWKYQCKLEGDINKFSGHEFIEYEKEIVFTHDFFGGAVIVS
jgi:hypothetical protein